MTSLVSFGRSILVSSMPDQLCFTYWSLIVFDDKFMDRKRLECTTTCARWTKRNNMPISCRSYGSKRTNRTKNNTCMNLHVDVANQCCAKVCKINTLKKTDARRSSREQLCIINWNWIMQLQAFTFCADFLSFSYFSLCLSLLIHGWYCFCSEYSLFHHHNVDSIDCCWSFFVYAEATRIDIGRNNRVFFVFLFSSILFCSQLCIQCVACSGSYL